MRDTWYSRDLPVLTAVVEAFDRGLADGLPDVPDIASATDLPIQEVGQALLALDGEYLDLCVTMSGGDPSPWFVERINSSARRAVGQWPSPETLINRLATALEQVSDHTEDPQTKGKLRQAASALGGLTQKLAVEVTAKMLEHQVGLS
jgi:hypothetical protein